MLKDRIWTLLSRKISGEATTSELLELDDLLKTHVDMGIYFDAIDEFWKIPPEKDEEFLEATYHLHINRLKGKGYDLRTDRQKEEENPLFLGLDAPKRNIKRTAILVAGCFVPVLAALIFFLQTPKNKGVQTVPGKIAQSEVSTKVGSRTKIQLPDGSSVWLNGGSKLIYDNYTFGEKSREVTLLGEGYFDVARNVQKPFIIHTNKMDIKVTGTTFNVKAYPGEKKTETSLIRGSIEVSLKDRQEKIIMKPNDKLIVSEEVSESKKVTADSSNSVAAKAGLILSMSHLTVAADDISIIETAWVENKLMFDNETFEDVSFKMEKWYGVSIHFAEPELQLIHLTGTFEKETINEALEALQISTPLFKYKINNNNIIIFK